jgi:hypothetical protein
MSDQSELERRYRRLLVCYPAAFRRQHEEEMIAVLLACAGSGRRGPGTADAVNLLWHALRLRIKPASRRSVPTVFWGVRLMLLAAVLELGALAVVVASQGSVKAAVLRHFTSLNAAHAIAEVHGQVVSVEIGAPIAAAAWLVVAWANDRGHSWGRVGAVVLLGFTSVSLLESVARHAGSFAPADLSIGIVLWLTSLAASVLAISVDSNRHYRPSRRGNDRSRAGREWAAAKPHIATGS